MRQKSTIIQVPNGIFILTDYIRDGDIVRTYIFRSEGIEDINNKNIWISKEDLIELIQMIKDHLNLEY